VPVRTETDCFADEIAIDFPAISHLAARARDRFVSEHEGRQRERVSAEVSLSSAEARFGVKLPVEIAVWGVCERCEGRGGTWLELCSNCAGSGERLARHTVNLTVPPRVTSGARLHLRLADDDRTIRVRVRVTVRTAS
jgi:DnaJ-class molecular chaperone